MSDAESIQLVVPVFNEGENVRLLYKNLQQEKAPFDSLKFVYDFDEDSTLPVIAELRQEDARIVAEKNCYGRGIVHALRWGFAHVKPGPVVVLMADNSDKLSLIPQMIELWRQGAAVVCPSRYMKGGKQHGGGLVKSLLSRLAGVSLKCVGFPTSDPTNNFKLYDGAWLLEQTIESNGGFEVALELSVKAYSQGRKMVELPSEWFDRTQGQSKFRVMAWLPQYLKWYFRAVSQLVWKRRSHI